MLRIGKKSNISDDVPLYIILIILLSVYVPLQAATMQNSAEKKYPLPDNLDIILTYEAITNNCFAYQNINTGRVYQNILDVNKINDETLKACFNSNELIKQIEVIVYPKEENVKTMSAQLSGQITNQEITQPCALRLNSGEVIPASIRVIQ